MIFLNADTGLSLPLGIALFIGSIILSVWVYRQFKNRLGSQGKLITVVILVAIMIGIFYQILAER
jgi:hypothetical protein